jgi:hypothetical protein
VPEFESCLYLSGSDRSDFYGFQLRFSHAGFPFHQKRFAIICGSVITQEELKQFFSLVEKSTARRFLLPSGLANDQVTAQIDFFALPRFVAFNAFEQERRSLASFIGSGVNAFLSRGKKTWSV